MCMAAPSCLGSYKGKDLNIVSVFEAVGENAAGKMSDFDLKEIEKRAIPGTGSCGGMYTANTMSSARSRPWASACRIRPPWPTRTTKR